MTKSTSKAHARAKPPALKGGASPSRKRVSIDFSSATGRTRQAHKTECDINHILERFRKTGAIEHANNHAGTYGFAPSESFTEAMNLVTRAQNMFNELPADIRKKFGNSPENFLDFAQDPDNHEEMAELGLIPQEIRPVTVAHEPDQPPAVEQSDVESDE